MQFTIRTEISLIKGCCEAYNRNKGWDEVYNNYWSDFANITAQPFMSYHFSVLLKIRGRSICLVNLYCILRNMVAKGLVWFKSKRRGCWNCQMICL